ncbi:MAG: GldG family protein [bacterium]
MNFSKKTKLKSSLFVWSLIIVAVIIAINIVSYKIFYRIDLTQNKEFSISSITKSTLKNLDDTIDVKVYFSEKLPPQYIGVAQEVKDILDEYQNYSRGKLQISFIDPKDNEDLQKEAQELGIPQLQFNTLEKDQFQITQGYLGLVIIRGEKNEVLPVIEETSNLEYKLTAAIKKVVANQIGKIGFTTGHGEAPVWPQYPGEKSMLGDLLSEQFDLTSVDTTNGEAISGDIDTLVINGPKQAFTDRELYLVDQFLMKGKNIFFMVDGVTVDQNLMSVPNDTNLEKLLSTYGIDLQKNLVLDISNEVLHFNDGRSMFGFMANYPFWVKARGENFDKSSVIVNQLETLLFPWASSVSVNKDVIGDNTFSELVLSSEKSWEQKENFDLNPSQNFAPSPDDLYKRTLVAAVNGKFKSYFDGKEIPAKEISGEEESSSIISEEADTDSTEIVDEDAVINSTDGGRIVVAGDSDFITSAVIGRSQNNLIFFQNVIDVLTQDENLVAIRAKGSNDRPIKELTESEKNWIKFINILGVSVLVVVIGVGRAVVRRKGRKKIE